MNVKKLLRIAEILDLIFAGIFTFFTAYAFALNDGIVWLFLVLALLGLFGGLGLSSFVYRFPLDTTPKKVGYWLSVLASVASIAGLLIGVYVYTNYPQEASVALPTPEEPKPEVKKPWYKKVSFLVACISLGVVAVSAFSGALFETSGFSVSVCDYRLTKEMTEAYNTTPVNGVTKVIDDPSVSYAFTAYEPKFASENNKVAAVIVIPGFTRTKATMSQYAVELSKRGAAVFVIDPGSQGGSTNAGYDESGEQNSYANEANGANYLAQYLYNNTDAFPYLDRTRFGIIGHSAGGGNAVTVASTFAGADYHSSLIKSLYISGYIKNSAANQYSKLRCNAVNSYAYYDEGAFRYQTDGNALEVINSRFINEVSNDSITETRIVAYDTPYGDMNKGTYRMLRREATNHCFQMYDGLSITNSISFFRESLHLAVTVDDSSHTWIFKEMSTGILLVAAFAFLFSVVGVLLEIPFLRKGVVGKRILQSASGEYVYEDELETHAEKKPSSIPSRFSFKGKTIFWVTTIVSMIIACLDYIPLAYLSMKWFPDAANNVFTTVFPARMFNAVLLWATFNGCLGLVLFFGVILVENLVEKIVAKKQNREPHYDWSKLRPLRIDIVGLLKTLLLGIALFFLFYGVIQLTYTVFHQDGRLFLISAAPLSPRFLLTWLEYVPLMFLFYISNSIKVNCSIGMEGWKEWQVYLVGALTNSLALVFILIINYVAFFATGSPYYGYFGKDLAEVWLYVNMVFPLVPMMALLPIANRLFYRYTNRAYLGPIVTAMVFIMMSLTATISFMPL
ncbi:MAG: hypothetical protein SPG64_05420 [Candidatus Enteromonas sp.]|nr:hypothetical protein [Candidatus Enteromonas sp.]